MQKGFGAWKQFCIFQLYQRIWPFHLASFLKWDSFKKDSLFLCASLAHFWGTASSQTMASKPIWDTVFWDTFKAHYVIKNHHLLLMKSTPPAAAGAQGWPNGGSWALHGFWAVWHWHVMPELPRTVSQSAGQSTFMLCPASSKQKMLAMLGCLGAAEALQNQLLSPAHKPHLELPCSSPRRRGWCLTGRLAAVRCSYGPHGLWKTSCPCSYLSSYNEVETPKFVLIELSISEAEP